MGIFEKNEGAKRPAPASNSLSDQINMVGSGTVFEGTIEADSDVRVSGTLIGTLQVEGRVLVAEGGSIEGEITATEADIAGNVKGKLEISGRLLLKGSAHIEGEVHTERLIVEEGAYFSGECNMGDHPRETASLEKTIEDNSRSYTYSDDEERAPASENVDAL